MKKRNLLRGLALMVLVCSISVVTACANSTRGGGPNGGQQGPPPEAIAACDGMKEGDSVSFEGRRGESVAGTCQLIDDQLVAVPEGHNR